MDCSLAQHNRASAFIFLLCACRWRRLLWAFAFSFMLLIGPMFLLEWSAAAPESMTGVAARLELKSAARAAPMLTAVRSAPGNTNYNQNYIVTAYDVSDINLDGMLIAAGPDNDRNFIIYAVVAHPGNTQAAANFIIDGQVPLATP